MLINLVIFRYTFAKTVVIQQLSRKCITYISKTITLIALRYWNSMTSATSNSQTQTLQACYCKLIESFDGFMLIWLHLQMAKYQYLPLFLSLSLPLFNHNHFIWLIIKACICIARVQDYMLFERMASNRCNIFHLLYWW